MNEKQLALPNSRSTRYPEGAALAERLLVNVTWMLTPNAKVQGSLQESVQISR